MSENQETQYTEYAEPVNYFLSIICALLGGLLGILVWVGPLYLLDSYYPIAIVFVGGFAALGARRLNRKNGRMAYGIIALIATIICLIIGDAVETSVLLGDFGLSVSDYIEMAQSKSSGAIGRIIMYVLALPVSVIFGVIDLDEN